MYYFKTQEQALDLFKALNKAAEENKVIYITVPKVKYLKTVIQDLSILLKGHDIKVRPGEVKLKTKTSNIIIKVLPIYSNQLHGLKQTQIIAL